MTEYVTIELPDGRKAKFPKEMSRADMAAALNSFPPEPGGVSTNSGAVDELTSKMGSFAMGAAQGGMAGFEDNLAGFRGILGGQVPDGQDGIKIDYAVPMGDRYRQMRDQMRRVMGEAEAANPRAFNGGKMGGEVGLGLASGPFATGRSVLGTMVRGMGIGSGEGALHEIGNADGEDMLPAARRGILWGGGAGVAAPAIVGAGGVIRRAASDPLTGIVESLTGQASKGKASRAMLNIMRSSGKTPDEIGQSVMRAAQEGQPEYRLMDALGVSGQRAASGVARAGGDSGAEIAEYLSRRQSGQGERVGAFIEDGFGVGGTTAAKRTKELKRARSDAADQAYSAARGNAAPVDVRGALGVIDGRIGGMDGSGITGDSIDARLSGYRSRLAGSGEGLGADVSSAELSDFDRVLGVKQSIQDDIGAAVRAGRNNEARELGKLLKELDGTLEASSDMYRTANDGFREASRVIDAVPEGAQMATRGRAADNVPRFQSMTPDQQEAARVGYGDSLLEKLERMAAPTSNRAKPLQSPKREAEGGAMTLDPALYGRRLSRETEMWETQNRALGGSRTADNQADQQEVRGLAGGALNAGRSLLNMNLGDATAELAGALGPIASGQTDQTRMLISRALMSKDPQAALEPALREATSQSRINRPLEAAIRSMIRESGLQ